MVTKDSIDNIDEQIEKLKKNVQTFEVENNNSDVVETINNLEDTDTKVFNGNEELENEKNVSEHVLENKNNVSEHVLENKNNDNDILIILILIILIILVVLFGFILIY